MSTVSNHEEFDDDFEFEFEEKGAKRLMRKKLSAKAFQKNFVKKV